MWLLSSTDGGSSFAAPVHVDSIELFDSNQFAGSTGTVDCGDGPFACESGFTFSRFFSNSAVAADETGVHVVWASELPSGQNQVFVRNSPDGLAFEDAPILVDPQQAGHQWFPDIATADGTISVIFYDSRAGIMRRWKERGHIGVEMEVAVLYTIAALHGIEAAALMTVSDMIASDGASERISDDELKAGVDRMMRLACQVATFHA